MLGALPGRARATVALPVSSDVWSRWNRRNLTALFTIVVGLGLAAPGAIGSTDGLLGVGFVVVLAAMAYRTRAHHNFWTTCRLNEAADVVIVEPTHREFDRQARQLFERSVRRR